MTMSAAAMLGSDGALTVGSDTRMTPDGSTEGAGAPPGQEPPFAGELRRVLDRGAREAKGANEGRARVLPNHAAKRAGRSPFEAAPSEAEADVMVAEQRVGARQGFVVKGSDADRADNLEDTLDDARREGSPAGTERPASAAITLPSPPPRLGAAGGEREADSTFPEGIAVPEGMCFVDEHTAPSGEAPLHDGGHPLGGALLDSAEADRTIDEAERAEDDAQNAVSFERLAPYFADAQAPRIEISARASISGGASASGPSGGDGGVASPEGARRSLTEGARRSLTEGARRSHEEGVSRPHARAVELRGQARAAEPPGQTRVDEWTDQDLRTERLAGLVAGSHEGEGMSSRIAAALSRSLEDGRDRGRTTPRLDERATATATATATTTATARLGDTRGAARLGDAGASGDAIGLNTIHKRGAAMASFGAEAPVDRAISFEEPLDSVGDSQAQATAGRGLVGAKGEGLDEAARAAKGPSLGATPLGPKGQSPDPTSLEASGSSAAGFGPAPLAGAVGWDARHGAARRRSTFSAEGELPRGIRWTSAPVRADAQARSSGVPRERTAGEGAMSAPGEGAARPLFDSRGRAPDLSSSARTGSAQGAPAGARGSVDSTARASGEVPARAASGLRPPAAAARTSGDFVARGEIDSPPWISGEFNARPRSAARTMTQRSFGAAGEATDPADRRPFLDKDARAVALNTRWAEAPAQAAPARAAAPDRSADRASGEFGYAAGAEAVRAARAPAEGPSFDVAGVHGQPASRETGTFAIPRAGVPGAAPANKGVSSGAEAPRAASQLRADGASPPRVAAPRADGAPSPQRDARTDAQRAFDVPPPSPRTQGAAADRAPGASPPRSPARPADPWNASPGAPAVSRARTASPGTPTLDPRSTSPSAHGPGASRTDSILSTPERAPGSASSTGTFGARSVGTASPSVGRARGVLQSDARSSAESPGTPATSARSPLDLGWAPPLPGAGDSSPALSPEAGRNSPAAAFQAARAALAQSPIQADARLRSMAMNDSPPSPRAARRATATDPLAAARRATAADPLSLARFARGAGRDLAPGTAAFEPRDSAVDSIPATHISAASGWIPDTKRDPSVAQRAASHHPETAAQSPPRDTFAPGPVASGLTERDDSPAGATAALGATQGNTFHLPPAPNGATNANSILAMDPAPTQGNTTTAHLEERLGERRQRVAAGVRGASLPRETRAEADIPELGRIAVLASPRGAEVDVRVTAQKAEAARVLQEAAPSLESHLRHNAVPLGHLSVGDHATGQSGHNNAQGDPRSPPAPRDQDEPLANTKAASPLVSRSRVRVVL